MKVKVKRLSAEESARVGDELVEMSGALVDPNSAPLTPEEKRICQGAVERGFWYFEELGWSRQKEGEFLARHSVRREIDRLQGIINDVEGLKQRALFFNQVRMLQMLPAAIAIVQNTLAGAAAKIVPTESQYLAARDVIEWCGLSERRGGGGGGVSVHITNAVALPQIDRTKPVGEEDDNANKYDREAVMQRTRVRSALDRIVQAFGSADEEIEVLTAHRDANRIRKIEKKKKKKRDE